MKGYNPFMDVDDDERAEVLALNKNLSSAEGGSSSEYARISKFMRARGLFPRLSQGSTYDNITLKIFTYIDLKKRSMQILGQLNSKGYQLTYREKLLQEAGFISYH